MQITLTGKQQEVFALPAKGHIVVLGTAGSGKTTIALCRARHLANIPGGGRVLLVTFNRALVEYMRGIDPARSSRLVVENYHRFARGYLEARGKMPRRNGILSPEKKDYYIGQALEKLKAEYPAESTFRRPREFFVDEITFIERFGFYDLDEYRQAERVGRGSSNIKRENRKWIFAVYEEYQRLRQTDEPRYDWDDLALYVFRELQQDNSERRYTHVIVDEGQDFSPMMIKSLVAATAEGGSFTFFGDVAQQIYGSRLSWRDSGITTNKIWRFNVNYRNPESIIAFATAVTKTKYWRQDTDMVEATSQIAKGPRPILVEFPSPEQELSWVAEQAMERGKIASAVIVCRNRAAIAVFSQALRARGCNAVEINRDTPGFAHKKEVYLTTYHAAKGMEFDHVFIPHLTEDNFPDSETVAKATSKEDAYADEIKLLYVAATRSRFGLYMTFSGTLSSLFPQSSDSYDFYIYREDEV